MKPAFDLLIVHRDPAVTKRLGFELRQAGHRVCVASGDAAACEQVANAGVDLVLSDVAQIDGRISALYRERDLRGDPAPPLIAILDEGTEAADVADLDPSVTDCIGGQSVTALVLRRICAYAELGWLRKCSARMADTGADCLKSAEAGEKEKIARFLCREAEARRELAGRVHNGTLQDLAVATLQLQVVLADLKDVGVEAGITAALKAVERSISDLRLILYDLGPRSFFDAGLDVGLASIADQARTRWKIELKCSRDAEPENLPGIRRLLLLQSLWGLICSAAGREGVASGNLRLRRLGNCLEIRLGLDREDEPREDVRVAGWDGVDTDAVRERLALVGGVVRFVSDRTQLVASIVIPARR